MQIKFLKCHKRVKMTPGRWTVTPVEFNSLFLTNLHRSLNSLKQWASLRLGFMAKLKRKIHKFRQCVADSIQKETSCSPLVCVLPLKATQLAKCLWQQSTSLCNGGRRWNTSPHSGGSCFNAAYCCPLLLEATPKFKSEFSSMRSRVLQL